MASVRLQAGRARPCYVGVPLHTQVKGFCAECLGPSHALPGEDPTGCPCYSFARKKALTPSFVVYWCIVAHRCIELFWTELSCPCRVQTAVVHLGPSRDQLGGFLLPQLSQVGQGLECAPGRQQHGTLLSLAQVEGPGCLGARMPPSRMLITHSSLPQQPPSAPALHRAASVGVWQTVWVPLSCPVWCCAECELVLPEGQDTPFALALLLRLQYWVPGLYHIGEFRERLEVLFPTRKVLPVLASVLFRPNNNVWSLLTDKMTQLRLHTLAPGPSSTRVGVQYRRDFGLHPQDALQATAQCLEALATSAPRDFPLRHVPSDPRGDGRPAADGGPTGAPLPGAPSRLLVASVDREFREAVANGSVLGIQGQEVTVLTTDSAQVSNDSAHNERALVDMLALAFSSTVLLLTPFSSFGYATAAFSSATPYFLSDTCSATTAEACFLLPPKRVTCPGAVDRGTFSIEYGRMGGKGEPVLEACPDVVWLEAYYLRTGRQFECCNHGFRLIQR